MENAINLFDPYHHYTFSASCCLVVWFYLYPFLVILCIPPAAHQLFTVSVSVSTPSSYSSLICPPTFLVHTFVKLPGLRSLWVNALYSCICFQPSYTPESTHHCPTLLSFLSISFPLDLNISLIWPYLTFLPSVYLPLRTYRSSYYTTAG